MRDWHNTSLSFFYFYINFHSRVMNSGHIKRRKNYEKQ
nr:MAG TPA: hypothetical protein [Caudoviricetes sp.]